MIFVQSEGTSTRRRAFLMLVDATDGITPETGESGGQPQISKNGAAWGNTSATLTSIGNGGYYVELTAGELDTVGQLFWRYKSANTAEFQMAATVVAANIFDSVRLGLTALPNAAAEAAGGLVTRGTGVGQLNVSGGRADADVTFWNASAVVAPNTAGTPVVDVTRWLGTTATTPNTAGTPVVDVTRWLGGTVATPSVTGVPEVDVTHANGENLFNYDFAIASATSTTVTLASTYANGSALPDDDRYEWCALGVVEGTGLFQVVRLSSAAANPRQYNVLAGSMPVQLDSSSRCITVSVWNANVSHWLNSAVVTPTIAGVPNIDLYAVSGDTAAADNAEKYFDGTGYADVLVRTTIATLTSQTSFTLTAGSTDNSAYVGCEIVVEDQSTAAQKAVGIVGTYTGSTRTVGLAYDPAIFTMAAGDLVTIMASRSTKTTTPARFVTISAANFAQADVSAWLGTVPTVNQAGIPRVDLTHIAGTVLNTSSPQLGVNVVNMASGTLNAAAVATDAAEKIADTTLGRSVANVENTASQHTLCGVVLMMMESDTTTNAGNLTIFKTDGSTSFAVKPITVSGSADSITKIT